MAQCPERYHKQLYEISELFSVKHPELRLELLDQAMQRVPRLDAEGQKRMISYITAWLSHMNFTEVEEDKLMRYFTVDVDGYACPWIQAVR